MFWNRLSEEADRWKQRAESRELIPGGSGLPWKRKKGGEAAAFSKNSCNLTWTESVCTMKYGIPAPPAAPISPGWLISLSLSCCCFYFNFLFINRCCRSPLSAAPTPGPMKPQGPSTLSLENGFWHRFGKPGIEREQPRLGSGSSAAAEEFPVRVLQQIISHHLRSLCKYPSTATGGTPPPPPPPLPPPPAHPSLLFSSFLRWEKKKRRRKKSTTIKWKYKPETATALPAADDSFFFFLFFFK